MKQTSKQRPEQKFRAGGVVAAVFRWTKAQSDGRTYSRHSVLLDRIYKDAAGNWQRTNSLDGNDIPKAILALVSSPHLLSQPQ